ncbi:LOW QUALITY PROTEIN: thrombospondin type-1 domain-containing protein 1 [Rhineura floridana]|uniref:LOW QUALITY PROTEIN: thrombospondin type-1 domain-containing protein 1 n=1 Tax=Rhineura floridana TaxID=261503 RepID=UPI002AC82180|nr:LOW QUALITY PROTEIN: thrombospondin type-1 domain-containing protein 1 [Rhineura floridana]
MKQMLKDLSNLLLIMLCDYVLGAVEYLILEQPTHVALSNGTVSVGLQNYYDGNVTLKDISILLIDGSTNQTVTKKQLLQNQLQDIVVFECFHFKSAGYYWFRMASESQWNGEKIPLSATWPLFHFNFKRSSEGVGSFLQLGLFTSEYLCPMNKTMISLDVILTSSLYELGKLISNKTVGLRTSKELTLTRSQWVRFDCHLVGQEAYIVVLLKSAETNSIIASEGPVDLVHRFGYKLIVAEELTCESSVVISVIPPPCTSLPGGNIAVFKELGPSGQRALRLHEVVINPEDNQIEFNCTLFDEGVNKYCFEFSHLHRDNTSSRVKKCVLIQRNVGSWRLWQAWSPCSVTCGDGIRERHRECLTSFPFLLKQECAGRQQETSLCSLEECSTTQPVPITPLHPEEGQKPSNNLVTVTGISLCLSIIVATVLITLWRKLCRTQKCSIPMRCDSAHSPTFRRNSDEENICQERQQQESSSEREAPPSLSGEPPDMPLGFRRSFYFAEGGGASASESLELTAQKIIPPIFSYRLAQQQLKEMKKQGLTETTKVYHVSQNPLTDTVLDTSVSTENQEAAATNKFRIKSPFLEQPPCHPKASGNRPSSRVDFTLLQFNSILSPSQSLIRRSHPRYLDNEGEPSERGYPRNSQFRRTASFHETKKAKPFRKRSMSTLTPCQTPLYHGRTRTWNRVPEQQHQPKPKNTNENTEEFELHSSSPLTAESMTCEAQNPQKWEPPGKKLDFVTRCQPVSQMCSDRSGQTNVRGSFLGHVDSWRNEPAIVAFKDSHQRGDALSPTQYRKNKCQSFPSDSEYTFCDNTSFGLAELEQPMIDLPGYFASNEGGEINAVSIDKLVI